MPLPPLFCGFLHVLPPSRSVYPRHRTLRPGGPSPRSGGFPEAAALRLLAGRLGERERAAEGRGFVSLWGTGNGEGGGGKGEEAVTVCLRRLSWTKKVFFTSTLASS